jgi:hypothetical protein
VREAGGIGRAATATSLLGELGATPADPMPVMPDDRATDSELGCGSTTRLAKAGLIGVIAVFVLLASVIALKTPAWESNDEPDHVQNIETLVAGHWYGMHVGRTYIITYGGRNYTIARTSSGTEAHQAPLYYLLLAGWQRVTGVPVRTPDPGGVDLADLSRGNFLYHRPADHRFLVWLRLPNVFLGALTIWFTFLAAGIITKDPRTPVVAASIIGFLPKFVFSSAFVTNDNLVNLLGAILAFVALRCLVSPTRWRMALVGVVVGLLISTKLSALPFAVVLVPLALRGRIWPERAQLIAVGCATSLVACGWYLGQNTFRYGSPLARSASERYLAKVGGLGTFGDTYKVTDPVRYIVVDVPSRFLHIFWYGSGWTEIFRWPLGVGLLLWLLLALSLLGLLGRHISPGILVVLGVLTVTGLLSVWIVAFQTATFDPRLALGAVPAVACLAALGLERWKFGLRCLFPLLLLGGTIFAIQTNVLAVHWS